MSRFARLLQTGEVRRMQLEQGSRPAHRPELGAAVGWERDPLGVDEREFIARRDGFYIATVGETGWPYVQFRGGPPGFVHIVDALTLAYADIRGNRQYITNGNLRSDRRVALFFMDYERRTRLKLLGHASTKELDDDEELAERVCSVRAGGRVERVMVVSIEGYDWNCSQHIPRRYSDAEVAALRERVAQLEAENAMLRGQG